MTTFRALPVPEGDAFLLQCASGNYLVDGGRRRRGTQTLPSMLLEHGVSSLDAAIVTHTDRDHVDGIEDLLRDEFGVREYWVPIEWLDTAHTAALFKGGWREWLEHARELLRHRDMTVMDDAPRTRERVTTRRSLAHGGDRLLEFAAALAAYCTHDRRFTMMRGDRDVYHSWLPNGLAIARAMRIIGAASIGLSHAPCVRFFEYHNARVDHRVADHPFVCVNGDEAMAPLNLPRDARDQVALMLRSVSLTRSNRESRVFQYQRDAAVLFCADSNLSFLGKRNQIELAPPAIVTVPHHGAFANACAYERVAGSDLTWVRSDRPKSRNRPCPQYVALSPKYCTACGDQPQSVELRYVGRRWITQNAQCTCVSAAN